MNDCLNLTDILKQLTKLFLAKQIPAPVIPTPLILASGSRPGMSAITLANRIIARKPEAGLPIGNIETGEPSADEIMIRIHAEELINMLQTEARVPTAIAPGTLLTAAGGNAGGPILVQGSSTGIGQGYSIIQ
jgi:hypothetical protein